MAKIQDRPVTAEEMKAARAERAAHRAALLEETGAASLIQFTVVAPGPDKRDPAFRRLFVSGRRAVIEAFLSAISRVGTVTLQQEKAADIAVPYYEASDRLAELSAKKEALVDGDAGVGIELEEICASIAAEEDILANYRAMTEDAQVSILLTEAAAE